jgi:hypothetical protein
VTWELRSETPVAAPPERVWRALVGFEAYPEWNPVLRVRGRAREGRHLWATLRPEVGGLTGPPVPFRPRVLVVDPDRELRWRTELGVPTAFAGEHAFLLEPDGEGTLLVQTEHFEGPLAGPVLERAAPRIRATFERLGEALADRVESA